MKILIIDDERDFCKICEFILKEYHHEITSAATTQEARTLLSNNKYDAVLVDINLRGSDMQGHLFIEGLKGNVDKIIILSGMEITPIDGTVFIHKNWELSTLRRDLEKALA